MTAARPGTQQSMAAMPAAIKDAEATKDILRTLRHFHLGNPGVRDQLESLDQGFLPALLDAYRDTSRLRYDYPLFLNPPGLDDGEELVKPIGRFLADLAELVAPGESAGLMLKDNLLRLEQALRDALSEQQVPVPARPLLQEQAGLMLNRLRLDEVSHNKLNADLQLLIESVPEGGRLLAYGKHPAIHLLIHVIRNELIPRHGRFRDELDECIRGLRMLLDVEREKSQEAIRPEALKESVGRSADRFDATALSSIMDHSRGSIGMSDLRKERVEKALSILESYDQESVLVRFVHQPGLDQGVLGDIPGFEAVAAEEPCVRAKELFDQEAARLAELFAAVRIARLEIDGLYDTAVHDPWFANFDWEAFSHDELLLVPAVIALESALRVAGKAMPEFSRLLNSGRPVQVLVRVLGHANPGRSTDEDPFAHYRTELGYLGIAHRQAVVCQSSAARHEHLLRQFNTALQATRTGLHLINVGLRPTGEDVGLNGWLVAGAALEGRVHPFFQVNPGAGDSFADRVDFGGNPQPDRDWPVHDFSYRDQDGDRVETRLAFTFADYALLISRLHQHFTPVPLVCEGDDLMPVAEYLELDEEQASEYIPFIWAINEKSELRQLVISRTLIHACRDRLNYWHSLQEMAGVRSKYLEQGIAAAKVEMEAAAAREKQELLAAHAVEIEQVRTEVAGEVMGRLTEVLMGLDLSGVTTGKVSPPAAETVAPEAEPVVEEGAAETEAESEVEEEAGFDEPWIDTHLCTSCNDCLPINPQLFVYADSNQAYISDPSLGTYAQLVEAAEICPSNCIHPGKPLNSAEPNLEELLERAAPYN